MFIQTGSNSFCFLPFELPAVLRVVDQQEKQCVCNFGLPYLSDAQIEILHVVEHIVFLVEELLVKPLAIQMAENKMNYFRFE